MNILAFALAPLAIATAPDVDLNQNPVQLEPIEFSTTTVFVEDQRDFFIDIANGESKAISSFLNAKAY